MARSEETEGTTNPTHVHVQAMKLTPLRQLEEEEKHEKNVSNTCTCASQEAHPPKVARSEETEGTMNPTRVHMQARGLPP